MLNSYTTFKKSFTTIGRCKFYAILKANFNKLAVLGTAILVMTIAGCTGNENFQRSTVVPAAEVDLKINQDQNGNYEIDMKVANLARPGDLTPPRKTYVVWVETSQGNFNIGQLKVNDKLNASLKSKTPYKPERVKITAEENPMATRPGSQVVLSSEEISQTD